MSSEPFFKLKFVKTGSGVASIGGRKYSVIAPAVICLNSRDNVSVSDKEEWSELSAEFSPSSVNSNFGSDFFERTRESFSPTEQLDYDYLSVFIERTDEFPCVISLSPSEASNILRLMKSFLREIEEKPDGFWKCRSRSNLLEILFILFKIAQEGNKVFEAEDSLSGRIIHYINCSYRDKISVADLCARFETNRTTLSKLIRLETGYSLIDYVNKTRVSAACLILRDTKLPVDEVSFRTGFNDPAHFSRIFKKHIRISPGEYRKKFSN